MNGFGKLVRNGLMIYGGVCLISGRARHNLDRRLNAFIDRAGERLEEFLGVRPMKEKETVIEAEFEEV